MKIGKIVKGVSKGYDIGSGNVLGGLALLSDNLVGILLWVSGNSLVGRLWVVALEGGSLVGRL